MLLTLLTLPPVLAAEPVFDAPLIELLPVGEIVADGQTPVVLQLLILDEQARPYEGLELKLGVDRRPVDTLEALGGGHYRATWVPPLVSTRRSTAVEIRAKTPERERLRRSWSVPLRPPLPRELAITSSPPRLIAGDTSASLTLTLPDGTAETADGAALLLSASAGELGEVRPEGGGTYTAQLRIDDARDARCVLVSATDTRNPADSAGLLAIPQTARRTVQLRGEPDSQLLIGLGDQERGPYPADASGGAAAELDLPPGVSQLRVISLSDGARSERLQDLPVRPSRRVQLIPLPPDLPADPGAAVSVRAAVVSPDCRPDAGAELVFTASAGTLGVPRHEGGGVFVVDYTPPASPGPLTLEVALSGDDRTQRDRLAVSLVDPLSGAGENPVHTLLLLPAEQRLPPNGLSGVPLTALALDAYGLPVRGVPLTIATVQGDGSIPVTASTDERGRAELYYTAGRQPGLVNLLVTDGDHTAGAALLQLPEGIAPDLVLPDAGSEAHRALSARWAAALSAP